MILPLALAASLVLTAACSGTPPATVPGVAAPAAPMLLATAEGGFAGQVLFTVGERVGDYRPPGVLDGMAAFAGDDETFIVLATHELAARRGYPYRLANGTELTGARITRFEIDRQSLAIRRAGLAYGAVRDRAGQVVVLPAQLNEGSSPGNGGLSSFCSAAGYEAGEYGFVDRIFFAHEEVTRRKGHPHGGSVFALDVSAGTLWALPALGRGAWENGTALVTPDGDQPDGHVALLLGDDLEPGAAPLYLWLGRKVPGGDFPDRNGLRQGQLHVWVADDGVRSPEDWSGSGTARTGRFVPLPARTADGRPGPGTDRLGYYDDTVLRERSVALGAFQFSRPEDLHTNPANGRQVVFASTGQGDVFPADDWGSLYLIDVDFEAGASGGLAARARLRLIYDGDETGDFGIRNPDNLVWASDGNIYLQEDKATRRAVFGADSGVEASIWQLDPARPSEPVRIAVMNRAAVPAGATDAKAGEIGTWESSGIIDVSGLIDAAPGEMALLVNVQAHSITDGAIGGRKDLVEGGQLLLLRRPAP